MVKKKFQFTLRELFLAVACFSSSALAASTFIYLQRIDAVSRWQSAIPWQPVAELFLIAIVIGGFFAGIGTIVRDAFAVTILALTTVGIAAGGLFIYGVCKFLEGLRNA